MRDLLLRNSLTRREPSLPDRVAQAGEDEFAARGVAQCIRRGHRQLARLQRHDLARRVRCHRRWVSLRSLFRHSLQQYTVVYNYCQRPQCAIIGAQRAIGVLTAEISMARAGSEAASKQRMQYRGLRGGLDQGDKMGEL